MRRSAAAAVLLALVAAVAGPGAPAAASGPDHWGAARQSAGRDGYNSAEVKITAGNAYLLRPKWKQSRTYSSESAPAIANGVVYAPMHGELRAVDRISGARRWSHAFPNGRIAAPVVFGDLVYVGVSWEGNDSTSSLYALDRATGRTVWRRLSADNWFAWTGVVGGGRLYTSLGDVAPLAALDPLTGRTLWARPSGSGLNPTDGVAYANGRLYLEANLESCIASVSAADGRGLVLHQCGGTTRTPVVTGGVLYTAARGSSRADPIVITASSASCTAAPCPRLWTALLPGSLGDEIAVGRGRVYVPTVLNESPVLQVLDATSGRTLFSWLTEDLDAPRKQAAHRAAGVAAADRRARCGGRGVERPGAGSRVEGRGRAGRQGGDGAADPPGR